MIALHTLALARIGLAQTPLPPLSGPIGPGDFMALSERVTGHGDLSPALGARILSVLMDTGQMESLQALYGAVSGAATGGELPDSDTLRQILHVWYLGRITIA
jgi:hypothetical protein